MSQRALKLTFNMVQEACTTSLGVDLLFIFMIK